MAMHVTIGYGDEGAYQRTEQEVLTPLRRTTTSCVAMSSIASCSHPLTVGTLAETTSLQAALVVVPVMLVLAAARLTLVSRVRTRGRPRWLGAEPRPGAADVFRQRIG